MPAHYQSVESNAAPKDPQLTRKRLTRRLALLLVLLVITVMTVFFLDSAPLALSPPSSPSPFPLPPPAPRHHDLFHRRPPPPPIRIKNFTFSDESFPPTTLSCGAWERLSTAAAKVCTSDSERDTWARCILEASGDEEGYDDDGIDEADGGME